MGCYHIGCDKECGLVGFFFTQKIGEYGYGFTSDAEEEISGDSLTVYGSTIIADASDFIRAFPQYTLDDYLYRLSCAQIQFMSVDNTHTKYLKGADKKAWNNYAEALKAQTKLENFMGGLKIPDLKAGEEFEIPVNQNKSKKSKNKA